MAAMLNRGVDMTGIASLSEMFARLRQAVANAKPGEVILGAANWNVAALAEKRGPNRQELDQVSTEHPILVYGGQLPINRGAAFLNSAALKAAGITRETKTYCGYGKADLKIRTASQPVSLKYPASVSRGTVCWAFCSAAFVRGIRRAAPQSYPAANDAIGLIAGIRDLDLRPEAMRAYWHLWREKKLTMRVSMGLDVVSTDWDKLDDILKAWGVGPGFGDHMLRIDSVSEFAVDTAKGLMREDILKLPGEFGGPPHLRLEQMRQAMITMNLYGWRPAPLTSGDRTLDYMLDAFAAADAQNPIGDKRWIVEHVPFVQPDQMDRMAKLGILVSANIPGYTGLDADIRNFGQTRAEHRAPMRELLDHHVIVGTGSDWPGIAGGPDNMSGQYGLLRHS